MDDTKKALAKIQEEIQENQLGWEAEENHLTALPPEVTQRLLGYNYESEGTSDREVEIQSEENYNAYKRLRKAQQDDTCPPSMDWRNVNGKSFITKVKNQGDCGSCVSFATVAALEAIARIRAISPEPSGVLPLLSEGSLHFCAGKKCDGWNLTAAFTYCTDTGVVPDSYFPYTGGYKPCNPTPQWDAARTKIKASHKISQINEMIDWLAKKGPLATRFNVYSDFYSYKKGIYKKTPSAQYKGGHAVLCVGYDSKNNAWICKNSWGSRWGEEGYFRIAMGECGIDACMYAIDSVSPEYPVYMDVMVRDNFADFGQESVSGNVCASPDIVPVGLNALTNPTRQLTDTWFQDIGTSIFTNANNVIYMRGISHNPQKTSAKFYLYYSKASLLMYPDQWKNNLIPCSDGNDYCEVTDLSQGDLAVTDLPYIWKPSGIQKDHYCLIGRVVTPDHPNPIPSIQDVREFAKFIAQNPNYCMRNIALVEKDIPDYSVEIAYEQGKIGTEIHFIVENFGCSEDAEFSLSSSNSQTTPPISITKQKVPKNQSLTGVCVSVPAEFQSKLLLNFWNKHPEKAQEGWTLCLKAFYIVSDSELEQLPNTVQLQYGNIGPETAVVLGDYTIMAKSNTP